MQPIHGSDRHAGIDALRAVALFGVVMVNLLTLYRVSLFQHILRPESDVVSMLSSALLEFKAVALFSFLFGVGIAIQSGRVSRRGLNQYRFLVTRFVALLAIGLVHIVLVWNGDILVLYALCGFLATPLLGLDTRVLAVLGAAAIVLPNVVPLPIPFPPAETLRTHAAAATRVYATAGYFEITAFRWGETRDLIGPLLVMILPKTFGLILCGAAAWRSGFLERRDVLRAVALAAGIAGLFSPLALALAYCAAALAWMPPAMVRLLAPLGRMSLTNYLCQSLVLGFVFYGYGLGLFGKLSPASAALIGVALYAAQVWTSRCWLQRYRFGPVEWIWRTATYGRLQPMRF